MEAALRPWNPSKHNFSWSPTAMSCWCPSSGQGDGKQPPVVPGEVKLDIRKISVILWFSGLFDVYSCYLKHSALPCRGRGGTEGCVWG